MTWELCADLTGRYLSIFLTDDMGIQYVIKFTHDMGLSGKHRRPRWEVAGDEMGRRIYACIDIDI